MEALENRDQGALLGSILAELTEQSKREKKRLFYQRVICFCLIAMVGLLIAGAIYFVPSFNTMINGINAATNTLSSADVDGTIQSVQKFAADGSDMFAAVSDSVSVLDELDVDSLNLAIAELETTVKSFSALDVDMLNEAILNLNTSVQPFATMVEKLGKLPIFR